MSFLDVDGLLFTSKRYEDIYIFLKEEYNINYPETFMLACALGFKQKNKVKIEEKGRELRINYFNKRDKRYIIYSILLSDKDLDINIESLFDKDLYLKFKETLESYAEGGMLFLEKEVFKRDISQNIKVKTYNNYIMDITNYVYSDYIEPSY